MTSRDPVGRQAEFFDTAFTERTRENLSGFYAVCATSNRVFTDAIAARSEGARVLEIGCGDDAQAFRIAHLAERVDAIDVAPVGVRRTREEAERRGFANVVCH
ncbi:MAG: hypothetical protein QHI48_02010, partial [Bacteroidota bacterium]|nr:hypothetical protein [Bacteroidota bacterium]